jgi:hypothetical protein
MRKFILVLTLILLVLIVGTVVLADDDAVSDDEPSLCFDGTWHCPDPEDPAREEWNWECGWYWGHFYAGLISTVPDKCDIEIVESNLCSVMMFIFPTILDLPAPSWDIWDAGADGLLNPGTDTFIENVPDDPGLPTCVWEFDN